MPRRISEDPKSVASSEFWATVEGVFDAACFNLRPIPRGRSDQLYESFIRRREGEGPVDLRAMQRRLPEEFRNLDMGATAIDIVDFLLNYERGRILNVVGRRGSGKSSLVNFIEEVLNRAQYPRSPFLLIVDCNVLREAGTTRNEISEKDFLSLVVAEIRRRLESGANENLRRALTIGLEALSIEQSFAGARLFAQEVASALPDQDTTRLVLAFDNLDHLDVPEVQIAMEIAKEIEISSGIGSIVCLRPATLAALIERTAARSLFDYRVFVGAPDVTEWLSRLPREIATAAVSRGTDVRLARTMEDAVYRFIKLIRRASEKGDDALGLLAALSANDTRTLARLVRRMLMHRSIPDSWILSGNGEQPVFYALDALLEGSQSLFAPSEELPNLLSYTHAGSWDFLVQHRILTLLDAGDGSAQTTTLLRWLECLGYEVDVSMRAIDSLHKTQLLESSNAELRFTLERYPESLWLTTSGTYYLHTLLRGVTYLTTAVVDVPLEHAAYHGGAPDTFVTRLTSLLEYIIRVRDLEQRQISALASYAPTSELGRVVDSLTAGGLFTSSLIAALEEAVDRGRHIVERSPLRSLLDEIVDKTLPQLDKALEDMNQRLAEIATRMGKTTPHTRLQSVDTPRGAAILQMKRLGDQLQLTLAIPRELIQRSAVVALSGLLGGNETFLTQIVSASVLSGVRNHEGTIRATFAPIADGTTEWTVQNVRFLSFGRHRRQGYLVVEQDHDRFKLRLFERYADQLNINTELGSDALISEVQTIARAGLDKVETAVTQGKDPRFHILQTGRSLAQKLLSPTGKQRLIQTYPLLDRILVITRETMVPWEWINPSGLGEKYPMLSERWDVIRWPSDAIKGIMTSDVDVEPYNRSLATWGLSHRMQRPWRSRIEETEQFFTTRASVLHIVAHHQPQTLKLLDTSLEISTEEARYPIEGVKGIVLSGCEVASAAATSNFAVALSENSQCSVWAPVVGIRQEDAEWLDEQLAARQKPDKTIASIFRDLQKESARALLYVRYGIHPEFSGGRK